MRIDPTEADVARVEALVDEIRPHLAGSPPEVQGAVLAELLSMWIAGHYQLGDAAMKQLLSNHVEFVRQLIPEDVAVLREH